LFALALCAPEARAVCGDHLPLTIRADLPPFTGLPSHLAVRQVPSLPAPKAPPPPCTGPACSQAPVLPVPPVVVPPQPTDSACLGRQPLDPLPPCCRLSCAEDRQAPQHHDDPIYHPPRL